MQVENKTQWECICTCDGIFKKKSKMENAKNKTCEDGTQDGNHEAKKKNEDRKGEKWNKDYDEGKKKGDGKQKKSRENSKKQRQNLKGKAWTLTTRTETKFLQISQFGSMPTLIPNLPPRFGTIF